VIADFGDRGSGCRAGSESVGSLGRGHPIGRGHFIVTLWNRWPSGLVLGAALLLAPAIAAAADLSPAPIPVPATAPVVAPPPSLFDPYRWEVRFGVMSHGVGSVESGTYDLSPEFVSPRLWRGNGEWWNVFVPRAHVGASVNLSGKTSAVWAGLLWSIPITERWFVEVFGDRAIHNGRLLDGAQFDQVSLGCRNLFHVGGSIGYIPFPRWSVMATFDHISNGNSLFGIDCERNQGTNNYGVKVGYSF
jgi:lipid A 3-O-deacylase